MAQDRRPISQQSSPLLRLPGELRNLIYTSLSTSTTLDSRPDTTSLAILRSCRQLHQETKDMWVGLVLFSFKLGPEELLNKLHGAPPGILSQISRVHINWDELKLYHEGYGVEAGLTLSSALTLLPGLQVDLLTVTVNLKGPQPYMYGAEKYGIVQDLIENGNGWKELQLITTDSDMFGFRSPQYAHKLWNSPDIQRRPQPATWNQTLLERDGAASGASVTIYRATDTATGSALNPPTRETFEQAVTDDLPQWEFMAAAEFEKEVLVVAERGRNVEIKDGIYGPYFIEDIRHQTHGMIWPEIRRVYGGA